MDTELITKELEQLKRSHKWTVVTCGCVLVLILAILMLIPKGEDSYKAQIQAIQDSIKVVDDRYQQQRLQFQLYRTQDSMRTGTIYSDLLRTTDMINNVNHRYELQRTHLSTLPVDEQVSYFANWLSQADSL